ncbi:ermin isoform X2 [Tenrec ecaudatus]|uniref:ermin isoform X2 n=1 Tax=Tenrec ecaudatus TaxID=94439 RepID=UPI003F5A160D
MTEVPVTFGGAECNGDTPPENGQQPTTKIKEEASTAEGIPPYHSVDPHLGDEPLEEPQGESATSQGPWLVNSSLDETLLQETSTEEMAFREGHQWEKIPLSSKEQEIIRQTERICEQPVGEGEEARKNTAYQATETEWLGFQKPTHVGVLPSKHDQEQERWDEETNDGDDCDEEEDEVRVIEFKKKSEDGSQLKDDGDASEDSPPSSPSSQPVTPEHPAFGKKSDVSRNAYSRYNTISYRKIRKGNTKQRIDEFESMMHL